MKDFGNETYSGDCFWFVATLKGLDLKSDFASIINLIAADLHLVISSPKNTGRIPAVQTNIAITDIQCSGIQIGE